MAQPAKHNAKRICEDLLLADKQYNIENSILASENGVIDRLLEHGDAMVEVYEELIERFGNDPSKLTSFLGAVVNDAAFWNPKAMKSAREDRRRLQEINADIFALSEKLADAIEKRTHLGNTSFFNSSTHYSIIGVIEAAAAQNHRFQSWVADGLAKLKGQFDLKYWPSLQDCIREVGRDAKFGAVDASDPVTDAATRSKRSTYADFLRALLKDLSLDERPELNGFKPTDQALATITNCALALAPHDMITASNVKAIRHRRETNEP